MSNDKSGGGRPTTYSLGRQLTFHYSAYEDRLILKAVLANDEERTILLTRRMVMLLLRQLLKPLPTLLGLDQTPHAYWKDVLQMGHQQAMASRLSTDERSADEPGSPARDGSVEDVAGSADSGQEATSLWLATGVSVQPEDERLVMALDGLPLPEAMTTAQRHQPIVAFALRPDHVHQVLHMLIGQAQQAGWHLPVDLPWMAEPQAEPAGAPEGVRTH
ncbi:MAG: hypothetical protein ACLFSG_08155 [Halothiobacillaceae bacterium]